MKSNVNNCHLGIWSLTTAYSEEFSLYLLKELHWKKLIHLYGFTLKGLKNL